MVSILAQSLTSEIKLSAPFLTVLSDSWLKAQLGEVASFLLSLVGYFFDRIIEYPEPTSLYGLVSMLTKIFKNF